MRHENVIMVLDQIKLYANVVEKKQHDNAIRMLCEELSKPEVIIRPLYEEILLEMKKTARIKDYLSILVCRTIRDLARGSEDSSALRLSDSHVQFFKNKVLQTIDDDYPHQYG